MTHIHIGHTFFGAGNLGDDLMLGGFLKGIGGAGGGLKLTCAIPFDLASQRRRFPEVEWHPYTAETRSLLIEACDVWLGLGGTILCALNDSWLLTDQLLQLELCRKAKKPVYFLGCSVDRRRVEEETGPRQLLDAAAWIWPRENGSRQALHDMGFHRASPASDLAHLVLADLADAPPTPGETGFVANFEVEAQYSIEALARLVAEAEQRGSASWLVQEIRDLNWSEETLLRLLPDELSTRLAVRRPDYADASLLELVQAWGRPEQLFTTRFHAVIIGAWLGSRMVAFERAAKVTGVADDLGVPAVDILPAPEDLFRMLGDSRPVDRSVLQACAQGAQNACSEFLSAVHGAAGFETAPLQGNSNG